MCNDDSDVRKSVDDLTRRFLCCFPVKHIVWDEGLSAWETQDLLINNTINHVRNVAFPLKRSYQRTFIKWLINNLECGNAEINDCVYNALANLVKQADADSVNCYKHYLTESGAVSLCESVQIISEGTTGLNTWQAALVLSEWCAANKSFFEDKIILELGSGLGLVGLSLALNCQAKHVVLTDCHEKVLKLLSQNVSVNLTLSKNQKNPILAEESLPSGVDCILTGCIKRFDGEGSSLISIVRHSWGEDDEQLADSIRADVILAADVVYDSSLFPALAGCVNACLRRVSGGGKAELVLVCTERNSATLDEFLCLLRENCEIAEEEIPQQKWFVWSTDTPIRLFRVTAK